MRMCGSGSGGTKPNEPGLLSAKIEQLAGARHRLRRQASRAVVHEVLTARNDAVDGVHSSMYEITGRGNTSNAVQMEVAENVLSADGGSSALMGAITGGAPPRKYASA
jgi:hypothetical protein